MSLEHPDESTPSTLSTAPRQLPRDVDVVVVGAGAAGCVLAARLSEDRRIRVLLLEAGEPRTDGDQDVPGAAFAVFGSPWMHTELTVPQVGLDGRQVEFSTGRALGGGSAVGTMSWFHGQPEDYEGWAAAGATGWGWNRVRPVLRSLEHHVLGPSAHHGAGGPMVITTPPDLDPVHVDFLEAGQRAGWPVTNDFNGTDRVGVGVVHSSVRDGRRHSTLDGYLRPAIERSNLEVRTGVCVRRVLFDGRRAVGVSTDSGDVRTRRVVLTAGAVRTPQVLLMSGVGDAAHLRRCGIKVVHHLPGVGRNFHDHPSVRMIYPVAPGHSVLSTASPLAQAAYSLARRGPLASFGTVGAMLTDGTSSAPSLQVFLALSGVDTQAGGSGSASAVAMVALLDPDSRGSVQLSTEDPYGSPEIDPGYLRVARDRERLRAGLREVDTWFSSQALGRRLGTRVHPAADVTSDAAYDAFLNAELSTFWHPAGTTAMGLGPDAVVSPELAVHGVHGVTVADASVMPTLTRGNTQAPTLMIAERAAELLRRAG